MPLMTDPVPETEAGFTSAVLQLARLLGWRTLQFVLGADAPKEADFFASHVPVRLDAIENYIRGLLSTAKDQKLRLLSTAAHIEPEFRELVDHRGILRVIPRVSRWAQGSVIVKSPSTMGLRSLPSHS